MKTLPVSIVLVGLWTPLLDAAEPEAPRGGGKPMPEGPRSMWHKQFAEGWKNADTDNDGVISRAEFDEMTRLRNLPVEKREVLFKRLDKDGNGGLSREELGRLFRPQEQMAPMVPRLPELDSDKNGSISFEEFKAGEVFKKLKPERQEALFRQLDVDGDGKISPKDHPPSRRPGGPGGPGGPSPHDGRGLFYALDKDADGFLSMEEFRRALMFRGANEEAQKSGFEKLDTNKDLKLDIAEFSKWEPMGEGRGPGKFRQPESPRRGDGTRPHPGPAPEPPPAGPAPAPPPAGPAPEPPPAGPAPEPPPAGPAPEPPPAGPAPE